jgi:hypothetical protein
MKRAIEGARTIAILGALPLLAFVIVALAIGLLGMLGVTPPGGAYLLFFLLPWGAGLAILVCLPSAAVWLTLMLIARRKRFKLRHNP